MGISRDNISKLFVTYITLWENGGFMKRKAIILCFIILSIPTIIMAFSYFDYRSNNITDTCIEEVELYLSDIKNQTGNITLEKYLDFNCDGFFVIGPYITSQEN